MSHAHSQVIDLMHDDDEEEEKQEDNQEALPSGTLCYKVTLAAPLLKQMS